MDPEIRVYLRSQLVDEEDISKILGVKKTTVNSWINDESKFSFPSPIYRKAGPSRSVTRIWLREDITDWASKRRPTRGRPRMNER